MFRFIRRKDEHQLRHILWLTDSQGAAHLFGKTFSLGLEPYHIRAVLMRLKDASMPFVIDLIEWKHPSDSAPPYARLNHLGIARIAMASSDLDGDMKRLQDKGVEFISEPATVVWEGHPDSRFVCFKDPDGTVLELVELLA